MKKSRLFCVLIVLISLTTWAVTACSYPINPPASQETQKIMTHIDNIPKEITKLPSIPVQKDYSSFYSSKSNFIYTAGVPIERIINILKPINPQYFDGISKIEFIKTNKFISNSKDGWYYSYSKSIRIFVGDESDEFLTRTVLHELKHNYCLTKERDNLNNCIKKNLNMGSESWDYCYHDEGCFLDTPIDEEYGFIR